MIISVSQSTSNEGWAHSKFNRVQIENLGHFCGLITTKHWAGLTWKDNYRNSKNFEMSELCVLDFDDGKVGMQQFCDRMEELKYWYVVGPSKSHQILKDKKRHDRFRAVLKWKEPIKDGEQYHQNMKRIQRFFHSDWQATGPYMKFAPCTKIHKFSVGPEKVAVSVHAKINYPKRQYAEDFVSHPHKSIPDFVPAMLSSAGSGERNITVYKAARTLKKRNFSELEAIGIVQSTGISLNEKEIKNTVHSAYKR
jgi:hypothetical protein